MASAAGTNTMSPAVGSIQRGDDETPRISHSGTIAPQNASEASRIARIGIAEASTGHDRQAAAPYSAVHAAEYASALRLLNPDLEPKIVAKLRTIEEQVHRIAAVTERLRTMEAVSTSEYIADGPRMIDVWGKAP